MNLPKLKKRKKTLMLRNFEYNTRMVNPLRIKHLRFRIYLTAIIGGIMLLCFGNTAFASLGGYEPQDLYSNITENMEEANEILNSAFKFSKKSPYEIINILDGTTQGNVVSDIISNSKNLALVVATLLLMIEFFRKTINFEWSSKWENILLFLVKIIVIKQVIQNADVIIGYIYAGFSKVVGINYGGRIDFLPVGNAGVREIQKDYVDASHPILSWFVSKVTGGEKFYYWISWDAVQMFYPHMAIPADAAIPTSYPTGYDTVFVPLVEMIILQPYFLVIKAIAVVTFVIAIGRAFELCVYTILAPLPIMTFASESTNDVAKSFIKNYISVVIQMAVITVMFMVYSALNKCYDGPSDLLKSKLYITVTLLALGLGVVKSGSWSKRICGIA